MLVRQRTTTLVGVPLCRYGPRVREAASIVMAAKLANPTVASAAEIHRFIGRPPYPRLLPAAPARRGFELPISLLLWSCGALPAATPSPPTPARRRHALLPRVPPARGCRHGGQATLPYALTAPQSFPGAPGRRRTVWRSALGRWLQAATSQWARVPSGLRPGRTGPHLYSRLLLRHSHGHARGSIRECPGPTSSTRQSPAYRHSPQLGFAPASPRRARALPGPPHNPGVWPRNDRLQPLLARSDRPAIGFCHGQDPPRRVSDPVRPRARNPKAPPPSRHDGHGVHRASGRAARFENPAGFG